MQYEASLPLHPPTSYTPAPPRLLPPFHAPSLEPNPPPSQHAPPAPPMWVLEFLPKPGDTDDTQPLSTGAGTAGDTQSSTASGKKKKKKTPYYHLVAGDAVIGRKNCDIIYYKEDNSISRQHARITILPLQPEEVIAVGTAQTIQITDLGARHNTKVNEDQLTPHEPRILRSGDVLEFGANNTKARIWHKPLVLCLSRVSPPGKQTLKEAAAKAGAHVVDKWRSTCTHLVVEKVATATTKVSHAVVNARPVVDLKWLTEGVLGRSSVGLSLPDPAKFRPDWSAVAGVRERDKARNELFKEIMFLFLVEEEDMEELVKDAGAAVERVYEWKEEEDGKEGGREGGLEGRVEEARRREGKKYVVVLDPTKTKGQKATVKKEGGMMMERLEEEVCGAYVTLRQHVAESIFRNRPLCDKEGDVIDGMGRGGGGGGGGRGGGRGGGTGKGKGGGGGGGAGGAGATTPVLMRQHAPGAAAAAAAKKSAAAAPAPAAPAAAAAIQEEKKEEEKKEEKEEEEEEEIEVVEVVPPNLTSPTPSKRAKRSSLHTDGTAAATPTPPPSSSKAAAAAAAAAASSAVPPPGSPTTRKRRQPPPAAEEEEEEGKEEGKEGGKEGEEVVPVPGSARKRGRKTKGEEEEGDQAAAATVAAAAAATAAATAAAEKDVPSAPARRRPAAAAAPPPPSLLPFKPLDPSEGWMVAPRKKPPPPSRPRPAGSDEEEEEEDGWEEGGRRKRGGREEEEGETVVEERDLLMGGRRDYFDDEGGMEEGEEIEPLQHVDPSKAVGKGRGGRGGREGGRAVPQRPDFKRFRKNVVMEVRAGERVRRRELIAVLPKESEMEVQLRNEEAMALARRVDAERLFDDEDVGPRRRKGGRK